MAWGQRFLYPGQTFAELSATIRRKLQPFPSIHPGIRVYLKISEKLSILRKKLTLRLNNDKNITPEDEKTCHWIPNPSKEGINFPMKISQARNLRIALIVLFCASTPLVATTHSTVVTSNVERIQNVAMISSLSGAEQGYSLRASGDRAITENNRAATAPSLAMIAPSPEWSAIFPIIGLIAAVAVTQLLRRRRIAQIRASSSSGQ